VSTPLTPCPILTSLTRDANFRPNLNITSLTRNRHFGTNINITSRTRGLHLQPNMNVSNVILCPNAAVCRPRVIWETFSMYKKRSKITKKASSLRGSESSGKASNVSSCQMIDIERITDNDDSSNDNSVIVPVLNPARRSIILDSSEEEDSRPESSVLNGIGRKLMNRAIIREYSESRGVKDHVLNQLGANHGLLDLFFAVFDGNLWDMLVTQTNLYAQQIMNDERRRKMDDGWFPVTHHEMMAYYALCILILSLRASPIDKIRVTT
ncbi:unnamed protein product, partial [Heterotrigona itama]